MYQIVICVWYTYLNSVSSGSSLLPQTDVASRPFLKTPILLRADVIAVWKEDCTSFLPGQLIPNLTAIQAGSPTLLPILCIHLWILIYLLSLIVCLYCRGISISRETLSMAACPTSILYNAHRRKGIVQELSPELIDRKKQASYDITQTQAHNKCVFSRCKSLHLLLSQGGRD